MRKDGVGFERIENFLTDLNKQKKMGKRQSFREKKVCQNLMEIKIRDEKKLHNLLKTQQKVRRARMSQLQNKGSRKYQRQVKHLTWVG